MIKTIYFVFFICAFSLGLWACTGKDSDKFKNLSSDQFEEMIQDKTIQLVDVRTVAEYSEGHIPGSININVLDNEFGTNIEELLQKDRPCSRLLQKWKTQPQCRQHSGKKRIQGV